MRPSEVRGRILHDHEWLRGRLDRVERLARQPPGPDGRADLRQAAQELLDRLEEHMRWEDRYLVPALREADAWGEERAARLEREHREQREMLHWIVAELREATKPASVIAEHVRDLVADLRTDMEEEEAFFLDPDVLRDDVVGIDVNTG